MLLCPKLCTRVIIIAVRVAGGGAGAGDTAQEQGKNLASYIIKSALFFKGISSKRTFSLRNGGEGCFSMDLDIDHRVCFYCNQSSFILEQ